MSGPQALRFALGLLADREALVLTWQELQLGSFEHGLPTILECDFTPVGLRLLVVIPVGQSAADWQKKAEKIADTFAVESARVAGLGSGTVEIELRVFDPLTTSERGMVPTRTPDLEAVVAGRVETGEQWQIPVLYKHLLIAGASGAGKSGVLWALIAGMAPAIRDGLVEVWAIDPKQVELAPGKELFTRYVSGIDESALALMTELVAVLDERLARMQATGSRKHVPTLDEPLIVMAVDEVLVLTAFAEREFGNKMDRLLRHVAVLGRAAAVSLALLGQDPSKEIMVWRQLMTFRIALRMDEKTQTEMVLGDSAREHGVRCHDISDATPGVAWVGEEGRTGFQRVRAFDVTDDDITTLVHHYSPQPRPTDTTAIPTRDADDDSDRTRRAA